MLILIWFERSLHPTQVSRQSCPCMTIKNQDVTRGRRDGICMGGSAVNGLINGAVKIIYQNNLPTQIKINVCNKIIINLS